MTYSEKSLEGGSEFEVEIVRYGGKWSGSIKFGVMKISKQKGLVVNDVPGYSPDAPNHFVWCHNGNDDFLFDNFSHEQVRTRYGDQKFQNLDNLREGNRVGLTLNGNGDLSFFC